MTLERVCIYGLAFILLLVLLLRRTTSVKARDVSGIIVAGRSSGPIYQNRADPPVPGGAKDGQAERADRVAWVIGIVAALIAAAQFIYDVLK
jgi:hypothetical protein